MAILGLQTERVRPPHEPGTEMILRLALSPYQIEKARSQTGYEAMGNMASAVGPGSLRDLIEALDAGKTPAEIKAEMDAGPKRLAPGDGSELVDGTEVGTGAPPEDAPEPDAKLLQKQFDMDWAAALLVKWWSYTDDKGRAIPSDVEHIRLLDAETRDWLHDKTWAAMRSQMPKDVMEGNL